MEQGKLSLAELKCTKCKEEFGLMLVDKGQEGKFQADFLCGFCTIDYLEFCMTHGAKILANIFDKRS